MDFITFFMVYCFGAVTGIILFAFLCFLHVADGGEILLKVEK